MGAATLPSSRQTGDSRRQAGLAERVFRIRESGIVVVLVVFVAVTAGVQHRFLDANNLQSILVDTAGFALLALGETLVVISKNVDLSIGSTVGLFGLPVRPASGIIIAVVFLAGLGVGLACGIANGIMVAALRDPHPNPATPTRPPQPGHPNPDTPPPDRHQYRDNSKKRRRS